MTEGREDLSSIPRVTTGVRGLDSISQGGLRSGGIYVVLGSPGAGKTILGNQMCFHHVATGGRALFVTLLTESHGRMLSYLKPFGFFDGAAVGTSLQYLSAYRVLEAEKLSGLLSLLTSTVRSHKATLLVLDGFVTAEAVADTELEFKRFIQQLQVLLEMMGCTALVLTGSKGGTDQYAVRTMVDGLLELRFDAEGMSVARSLQLVKARGGPMLTGRHRFDISDAGITTYPRIEGIFGLSEHRPAKSPQRRSSFGIKNLDAMVGGGARPSSVTMLLGPSGSGKTVLGLSFLGAGVAAKEPGLYVGFSEPPEDLLRNFEGLDLQLAKALGSPLIEYLWERADDDWIPDALAARLVDRAQALHAKRVFIDGIGRFEEGLGNRVGKFFRALCNQLRSMGITTVLSEETRDLFGPQIQLPSSHLAAIPDNVLLLRHVELRARLHRLISVLKMRGGSTDSSLREFSIGGGGIEISSTFDSAESILTGSAWQRPETAKRAPTRGAIKRGRRRKGA